LSQRATILIVEDNDHTRNIIRLHLELEGYTVIDTPDGWEALTILREQSPDLLLLDLSIDGLSGFKVLESLRRFSKIPVIIITVEQRDEDIMRGMKLGADDYLVKPVTSEQLHPRIKELLRRSGPLQLISDESRYRNGDLTIEFGKRQVWFRTKPIQLSPEEYKLLYVLARYTGKVIPNERLIKAVWNIESQDKGTSLLRAVILRLRNKIEPNPNKPRYIVTAPQKGYVLRRQSDGVHVKKK
jgi:DNA-binding response OmpR family regulator